MNGNRLGRFIVGCVAVLCLAGAVASLVWPARHTKVKKEKVAVQKQHKHKEQIQAPK